MGMTLILRAPVGLSLDEIRAAIRTVQGVISIHHLHLWKVAEHDINLSTLPEPADGQCATAELA